MLGNEYSVKKLPIYLVLAGLLFVSGCDNSPKAVETWPHAAAGLIDAAISDDGQLAVVSSVNFGAGLWDLPNNQLLFQWRHNDNPEDAIIALDLSPDGTRAVTADLRTFVIWDTKTGIADGYWQAPDNIRAIAVSDGGRHVLLGLRNGLAVFIDMNTGRRIEFVGHRSEPVASVDLSANGLWAFSGGNDRRAVLWNTQTGQPKYVFEHETRITKLRLDRTGIQAFTSGTRGNAFIWDLTNGSQRSRLALKPREYVISAADFSSDGRWLVTGAPGRDIVLWSTQSGDQLKRWRAATRNQWKPSGAIVWAVGFDKQQKNIISEASSGFGQMWQIEPLVE